MELLQKIGILLDERIITAASGADDFVITGGKKLSGTVDIRPSKNGALHLMCAALINSGTTILHNIPRNQEILRLIEVFESMNIGVSWTDAHSVSIKVPTKIKTEKIKN